VEDAKQASYEIARILRVQTKANPLCGKDLIKIFFVRLGPVFAEWRVLGMKDMRNIPGGQPALSLP
jgi:hypothetical protein